ncbi:hypothetical protein WM04_23570 [Burkholderia ubonensis]|nr:hypothetical protein WM04_23570 [Burkholderia ubonensis]OJB13472.1 hypothetical protein BGV53_25535 [Burkholderia ubonensis]
MQARQVVGGDRLDRHALAEQGQQPGIEKGVVRIEAHAVIRDMEAEVPLDVLERQFHGVYHTA